MVDKHDCNDTRPDITFVVFYVRSPTRFATCLFNLPRRDTYDSDHNVHPTSSKLVIPIWWQVKHVWGSFARVTSRRRRPTTSSNPRSSSWSTLQTPKSESLYSRGSIRRLRAPHRIFSAPDATHIFPWVQQFLNSIDRDRFFTQLI